MINELQPEMETPDPTWKNLVAGFPPGPSREAAEQVLELVDQWRAMAAAAADQSEDEDDCLAVFHQARECLSGRGCEDPGLRRLTEIVERFDLPQQYVFDCIKGIRREARTHGFLDFADLGTCAYLNASSLLLCLVQILNDQKPDEGLEVSLIALAQAAFLVHKLGHFPSQLERKNYFLPNCEVRDRGLDLSDQSQPVDEDLWKDLIQFQCRRIDELLTLASAVEHQTTGRLRGLLKKIWVRQLLLMKKIRRDPVRLLREPVKLNRWESWRVGWQAWRSIARTAP